MTEIISFESLVNMAVESKLLGVHTCIPGVIESIDNNLGTVNVSIAIKRVMNDDSEIIVPTLQEVPVIFSSGGGSIISHSLSIGDEGLIIFQERDFSIFKETGSISRPGMLRRHDYSDAVFFPSNISKGKVTPIPANGIEVTGDISITGNIAATGNIEATGEITAMKGTSNIALSTHTHIDSTGSPTQPPTAA